MNLYKTDLYRYFINGIQIYKIDITSPYSKLHPIRRRRTLHCPIADCIPRTPGNPISKKLTSRCFKNFENIVLLVLPFTLNSRSTTIFYIPLKPPFKILTTYHICSLDISRNSKCSFLPFCTEEPSD